MNFGIKIISKIVTKSSSMEKEEYYWPGGVYPRKRDWFTIQRSTSEPYDVIISSDAKKHLTEVNSQLYLKTASAAVIEGSFLNLT